MNFPTNPMYGGGDPNQMQPVTGTTGLALKFADGLVIVADRRASMGTYVASKQAKKVHKLNILKGLTELDNILKMLIEFDNLV